MMKPKNNFYFSVCVAVIFVCSCSHLPRFLGGTRPVSTQDPKKEESTASGGAEQKAVDKPVAVDKAAAVVTPKAEPAEIKPPHQEAAGDLELKVTRLWARVDELEQTISLQEQRIFLLQKGLMTGVVPDELLQMDGHPSSKVLEPTVETKNENTKRKSQKTHAKDADESVLLPLAKAFDDHPSRAPAVKGNLSEEDQKEYQRKLVQAQSAFDAQQYGSAIALYEKLGTEYADSVTSGSHVYWVGLSWFYLKNYDVARKYFIRFMESYKTNPMIPRARFYLAKTEYATGFVEKSVARLNDIIKEYPGDEISETARWEIKKIEEKL